MKTGSIDKLLLTPDEARKLLGIGRTTMYQWIKEKTIPTVRFPNCRNIYIPTESLHQFIARHTNGCRGEDNG